MAIRKDCPRADAFTFPRKLECPVIEELLEDNVNSSFHDTPQQVRNTMSANINSAKQRIKESGGNLDQPYVVDCDASRQKSCYMKNVSPCLTRSRNKGHWLIHRNRRTTIREMMRLQGIDPDKFKQVVSDKVMGQQIGNAMSVNVVEQILGSALQAAGLVIESCLKERKHDFNRWQSGRGFDSIKPKACKKKPPQCNVSAGKVKWPQDQKLYLMSSIQRRRLMVDSGASHHTVCVDDLTEEELSTRRPLPEPIPMQAATDLVWVTECVDVWVHELQCYITSTLIEISGCPCVLSPGKFVNESGFDYIWR